MDADPRFKLGGVMGPRRNFCIGGKPKNAPPPSIRRKKAPHIDFFSRGESVYFCPHLRAPMVGLFGCHASGFYNIILFQWQQIFSEDS